MLELGPKKPAARSYIAHGGVPKHIRAGNGRADSRAASRLRRIERAFNAILCQSRVGERRLLLRLGLRLCAVRGIAIVAEFVEIIDPGELEVRDAAHPEAEGDEAEI